LIDRAGYDHPLFFHPPGGIALDWIFYKTLGDWGFAYAQLFSYAVFFGSMMLLAFVLGLGSSTLGLTLVAGLSAFDPMVAHVATRFWLDGPLVAFTTLAVSIDSRPNGRLGMIFHVIGKHDPPQHQEIRIPVFDLVGRRFLNRKLPLPSGTGVDLTLDTTLNLDDLLSDYAGVQRLHGSASVQP